MSLLGFKTHQCDIVAPDGSVRSSPQANFTGDLIVIAGKDTVVLPGDEIRRALPNGTDETFEVLDPIFYDTGIMGAHFQVKVRRKGTFQHGQGGNYNVTVSGSNARVNIASTDNSSNIAIHGDLFGDVEAALRSKVTDQGQLDQILSSLAEMKRQNGQPGYVAAYQKFMAVLADHIGVVAPFLPALTAYMGAG
jgi:hypothetical protein